MNHPASTTPPLPTADTLPAPAASQPSPRLFRLGDVLNDFRTEAEAAHAARMSGQPRGALTGHATLDRELNGALAPGLHALQGNTGAGKTAFALQAAADCRAPALFVTCEMSPVELLRRHTARVTSTYLGRLKTGELRPDDAERLALQAIEAAPLLAFVDATTAPAPPSYLHQCAQVVKGDAPHLLIVVDSLHTWAQTLSMSDDRQNALRDLSEYEALNAGIRALQQLAAALRCPILMVTERNRDSMKSGGVNSGAGTRKIEYQGETVIELERKADAVEDGGGEVDVTLKLAKNRHGAAGKSIALKFNGALQRFREAKDGQR